MIASKVKLYLFDDALGVDYLREIKVVIPTGRRRRRFSYGVVARNLLFTGAVEELTVNSRLPFVAEFRKDGKPVDQYKLNLRDQSDAQLVTGSQYEFSDCAVPGVALTGSEDEQAKGSVERWIGTARDVSPGSVCIPLRTEYGDGTNLLRELRELNMTLLDVTVDADEFALRPECVFQPISTAQFQGTVIMAIVCLTDP